MEHLELKASEVTHASVALQIPMAATDVITVGALAPAINIMDSGTTTAISDDLLKKLPF